MTRKYTKKNKPGEAKIEPLEINKPKLDAIVPPAISEEQIKNLPVIQSLNNGIAEINQQLQELMLEANQKNTALSQDLNTKIQGLASAINMIAEGFSKLGVENVPKSASPSRVPAVELGHIPTPGAAVTGPKDIVDPSIIPPAKTEVVNRLPEELLGGLLGGGKLDKIVQIIEVLMQFAGKGAQATSGVNTAGTSGFDLLTKMIEINEKAEERALKRNEAIFNSALKLVSTIIGKNLPAIESLPTTHP